MASWPQTSSFCFERDFNFHPFFRKLYLLQDELKRVDSKLATTSAELEVATNQVDAIAKATKVLETKNMIDEGRKLK